MAEKTHQALLGFALWVSSGMRPSIHNILELKKADHSKLKNPVLLFVIPRAMSYVVERFTLEIVQAWELLDKELKRQGKPSLNTQSQDYLDLRRIRNKLVAHKIEESLATPKHEIWYQETYGSFENVLALITRVAELIANEISRLEEDGALWAQSVSARSVSTFSIDDIQVLFAVADSNPINESSSNSTL